MVENKSGLDKKEGFSSIIGFLFVAIGFAVGVGSLWRFPYIVGENGGAIFIFAYIIIILIIGIPLLTAEITMGYKTQKTAIQAYKTLAPDTRWYLGAYLHIAAAIIIVGYTIPIYAWILNYIYKTATGFFVGMNANAINRYFATFTANTKLIFLFGAINYILSAAVILGGLQKGVERISKVLLPLLAIIMLIIIVAGLRLPGSGEGVAFLLKPDFSKFTINSLLVCVGQAFFAIGIGMLASMVFGSYIKDESENIFKSASIICAAIIFAGIAAGFMIFPMVFANGLEPTAGPGLTFLTLPIVFNQIPGGVAIGTLFYIGFYIAAFTSTLGILESIVGVVIEQLNVSRRKALLITMISVICVAIPSILSNSFFNVIDLIENNYILILSGLTISIFIGWIWKIDNCIKAANINNEFTKKWMRISVKYVAPIVVIVLFFMQFF